MTEVTEMTLFVTDMTYMQMSYPSRKIVTEMTVTEMTAQKVFQS